MARRMLIDASHPEETRVVVVDGTRLEEFDFETATRKPLKGNIYLAKVIRIEPSLQAAFVEYGGNRHGFLAFSEIHPDYYQIPVADRERLIAEQQRLHAEADDDEPRRRDRIDRTDIEEVREDNARRELRSSRPAASRRRKWPPRPSPMPRMQATGRSPTSPRAESLPPAIIAEPEPQAQPAAIASERIEGPAETAESAEPPPIATPAETADVAPPAEQPASVYAEAAAETPVEAPADAGRETSADPADAPQPEVTVETLGGDDVIEQRETRERRRRNPIRQYKIQEVIKRRQILLVQVVKEERGNKGAALTTYLSLAGRYCVLMPNAGRGGGISRKISNPADRKRMKEVLGELDVPQGMGVILRTAGLERSTIDIKRDHEYLSRLWDSIREITMRSTAPALIYEEGDLIKRSLRDVYDTDIAQVLVEGEAGFNAASEFMRQLVPHQASKVELYKEPIPLFHRYQVENQFDAMHSPVVQLRSGGYIVINPTEALVAIDVNSGRSTKERNIEETALRTNIEAAEEIARQVRLRDLAGLIVIDFIDMEETRHQRQVEHKVKDAMRHDRARIQIGRISAFGLLEMSRQRLRPSLLEHSTEICPHCAGTGRIRSIESAALHALRAIEEEGVRRRAGEIVVSVPPNVALYLLNQKRHTLSEIEKRYGFSVTIEADDELHAADCEIERVRSPRATTASGRGPSWRAPPTTRSPTRRRPTRPRAPRIARPASARRRERGERERRDDAMAAVAAAAAGAGAPAGATRTATAIVRRPWARRISPTIVAGHGANGAADEPHDERTMRRRGTDGRRRAAGRGPGRGRARRGTTPTIAATVTAPWRRGDAAAGAMAKARGGTPSTARDERRRRASRDHEGAGDDHREAPVASAPMPIEGNPVEHMPEGHMPVEHAPYDPAPPLSPRR